MNQAANIPLDNAGRTISADLRKWGALAGGGALAIYGLTRRSPVGVAVAAAGGLLAYAGVRADRMPRQATSRSSILVNVSPEKAYAFWRDFENLGRFMRHIESVTVLDERRSRWVAVGPMGQRIQWEAQITSERANEFIAWQSLEGSDLELEGRVEFRRAPGDRGTYVFANIDFHSPKGVAAKWVATLLGKKPDFLMRQDLRRFECLIETGELPTTDGQSHGPRSAMTGVFRALDPDHAIRRKDNIREVVAALRRVS